MWSTNVAYRPARSRPVPAKHLRPSSLGEEMPGNQEPSSAMSSKRQISVGIPHDRSESVRQGWAWPGCINRVSTLHNAGRDGRGPQSTTPAKRGKVLISAALMTWAPTRHRDPRPCARCRRLNPRLPADTMAAQQAQDLSLFLKVSTPSTPGKLEFTRLTAG